MIVIGIIISKTYSPDDTPIWPQGTALTVHPNRVVAWISYIMYAVCILYVLCMLYDLIRLNVFRGTGTPASSDSDAIN